MVWIQLANDLQVLAGQECSEKADIWSMVSVVALCNLTMAQTLQSHDVTDS